MELKIQIKEVKEEHRVMTIEELAMWCVSKKSVRDGYYYCLIEDCKKRLQELGLVSWTGWRGSKPIGLFHTENIRDALPEEVIAWHCIQSHLMCITRTAETCKVCPKRNVCHVSRDCKNAKKLLEGKEIILELV